MASIEIHGTIRNIVHHKTCVIVSLNEARCGYKKKDGSKVDAKVLDWKCIFSKSVGVNIERFFSTGRYVVVRGEVLPYAVKQNVTTEGYTVMGYTIHHASYPVSAREVKMQKESQSSDVGKPDVESYMEEDF